MLPANRTSSSRRLFDKGIIDAIICMSHFAQLDLTFIAMTAEPHPSDWDPWVLSTINAPLCRSPSTVIAWLV